MTITDEAETIRADVGTVDAGAILRALREHVGRIVVCVLLAVALAFFYLLNTPPLYTSTALLEITDNGKQNLAELDESNNLRTLELKLANRSVLQGVIKAEHLDTDPEFVPGAVAVGDSGQPRAAVAGGMGLLQSVNGWLTTLWRRIAPGGAPPEGDLVKQLAARISVNLVRGSRLIALSASAHDPQNAQRLVNAVIREFYRQSKEEWNADSSSARELLLAEAQRVGGELRTSEEKLEAYRDQYNAVSLQDRQNIVVERLRDLNQQVAAAKNTRLAMEADAETVRALATGEPTQLLSIHGIADLPEIVDLRKQITAQEAQVAMLAQRYGPLHPTMIQAKSQLDELQGLLNTNVRRAAERLLATYDSTKATETALENSLSEQEKTSLELDRKAIPYHALERDVQANTEVYQKILENLKQADVTRSLVASNDANGVAIRVVEQPTVPVHPSQPRDRLVLGLSVAAGLFLGCGLVLGSRALDNSLASVDAAESFLGVPVLATVPRSRHRRLKGRPMVVEHPDSALAESFRSLRTVLDLRGHPGEDKAVVFTSSIPGEGKSFCSLNYAAACAQQGLRTLLIDGDLRRPSLQWFFADPDEKPGLSECLRDPSLFSQAVQRTSVENLFRLGDWHHHPGSAELLGKGGLREILRQAGASFDRVVIDTAPLLAVSDTLHMAQDVRTICLVVNAGRTPRRSVRRAVALLQDVARRPVTGAVLNKITPRSPDDHYYYASKA